jgi:hypothetical protein
VFSLVDEETRVPKGSDAALARKLCRQHGPPPPDGPGRAAAIAAAAKGGGHPAFVAPARLDERNPQFGVRLLLPE